MYAGGFESMLVGFVLGVAATLAVQVYLLWRYMFSSTADQGASRPVLNGEHEGRRGRTTTADVDSDQPNSSFELPRELTKLIRALIDDRRGNARTSGTSTTSDQEAQSSNCLFLNLICQFLFRELRDTLRVRRWFMHKLSVEFEELLQRTTVGKLIEKITVRDLQLGHQFPVFKSLSVEDVRLHEAGHIEELDVLIDLDYEGGFQLAVDADLVLHRSAFLAVRVAQVKGSIRLRFSRSPYTHWSLAFCVEPHLDVQVESHFQGRPLPHVTSLIANQIRRLVKGRHTLPNYKVRYRPFFEKPACGVDDVDVFLVGKNRITEGLLDVSVIECSRLFGGDDATCSDLVVFCTLALDVVVWGENVSSYKSTWLTRDVNLVRQPGQIVGVTFRQEFILDKYEHCVIVETVASNSPASLAGLRCGDLVVAINGSKVTSVSQATKLCKANYDVNQPLSGRLIFGIERIRSAGHNVPLFSSRVEDGEETMLSSAEGPDCLEASLAGETEAPGQPRVDKSASHCDDSSASTATNKRNNKRPSSASYEMSTDSAVDSSNCTLQRTSALKFKRDPVFRETFSFQVESRHRFMNVCVWRRRAADQGQQDRSSPSPTASASTPAAVSSGANSSARAVDKADVLLGHVSISLLDVAIECTSNSRGLHRRTFQLLPPEPKAVAHSRNSKLASHPGFDKTLCYGDVTLSFVHKPQRVAAKTANVIRDDPHGSGADEKETSLRAESDVDEDASSFSLLNDSTGAGETGRLSHDFIITQFNSTTSCHFCGKKVWFKIAFKCRFCALVCHKKCVAKCRDATTCCRDDRGRLKTDVGLKITNTDVDSGSDGIFDRDLDSDRTSLLESPKAQRRLRSLLSVVSASHSDPVSSLSSSRYRSGPAVPSDVRLHPAPVESLVRADSSQSLAPPLTGTCEANSLPVHSRSLPPSPQTSPATSRKTSLQSSGSSLFEVGESGDIGMTIERLLQYANDDTVVSVAKEKGRELFANDLLEERKSKLDSMVTRLQVEIDQETERRNFLAKSERQSITGRGQRSRQERTRLALLLAKSDEKIQALSILMLFYCSGLQHCNELEDTLARGTIATCDDDQSTLEVDSVSEDVVSSS